MADPIKLQPPLTDDVIEKLKAGDRVLITGVIYTGRDMAHKYMVEGRRRGEKLPFDPKGQILYYTGPTPASPGRPIGSAGPTTSYRMDKYAPELLELGLKGMIGKGPRGKEVKDAIRKCKAVYLAAIGAALHFILVVKSWPPEPMVYAAIVTVLLGYRLLRSLGKRAEPRRRPA